MTFSADLRLAATQMLTDYSDDAGIQLQVYRARPESFYLPTAFVDAVSEKIDYVGPTLRQRTPSLDVVVVWGVFDSGEAVDQRDVFVDGFLDWCASRYHAAGANTLLAPVAVEDIPDFTASWVMGEKRSLYASRITLEGYAEN